MPRIEQQRITPTPDGATPALSNPQQRRVTASPVGSMVQAERPDTGLGSLIQGLSSLQPGLEKFVGITSNEINARDAEAGTVARQRGEQNDQSKSAAWINGYMKMDGYVKATDDAAQYRQDYYSSFNPETDNFDQWSKKWWQDRAKGVEQVPSYLDGYTDPMVKSIESLRAEHHKDNVETVITTQRTNALQVMDTNFRAVLAKGPLDPTHLSDMRQQLQANYPALTKKEYNSLVLETLKPIGDAGNPFVYDALKKNLPDGTPGMYFIPEMKEKIDQAQAEAFRKAAENETHGLAAAERARKEKQNSVTLPIFLAAESGEMTGEQAHDALVHAMAASPSLFHTDEAAETLSRVRSGSNAQQDVRQARNATQLVTDVYMGRAGLGTVNMAAERGDISYAHQQAILQDVQNYERMQKEQGEAFDKNRRDAAQRANDFNLEKILMKELDTARNIFDPTNQDEVYYERLKATGLAALNRLVFTSGITDMKGLTEGAQQIGRNLAGQQEKIKTAQTPTEKDRLAHMDVPTFKSMAELNQNPNLAPEVRKHNIRELVRSQGHDPDQPPPRMPPKPAVEIRPLDLPPAPTATPIPAERTLPSGGARGAGAPTPGAPKEPASAPAPSAPAAPGVTPTPPAPKTPAAPQSKAPSPAPSQAASPKPANFSPSQPGLPPLKPEERQKIVSDIQKFKSMAADRNRSESERTHSLREMALRARMLGLTDDQIATAIRRPLSALGL